MQVIDIIGLCCMSLLIAEYAAPIQSIKGYIYAALQKWQQTGWYSWMYQLINCPMCIGFWLGFFYFDGSLIMGSLVSISSEALHRIMNRI